MPPKKHQEARHSKKTNSIITKSKYLKLMNRNIIITFLILILSLKLSAQMDLNKLASEEFHKVAQIEGSENILRDYFSEISNPNDTLYIFLCQLMFAPRLEGYMTDI
ncbi:MAG: hypothetical protein E7066_00325, partial [Lentimicrobiaceae bacterium]|nr:hypothetical protein [Lentimicrobiaceae bacterium]